MSDKFLNSTGLTTLRNWIVQKLGLKQDTLVSGTNIKTINSQSILGSGDLEALTRDDLIQVLENYGVDHLEVDEDGYLKITDMYFNTPYNAGYITDQSGNFIHSRNDSSDSWNIVSYDGTPKLVVPYEGNVRNKIGAGLEVTHSLIDTKQSNNGVSQVTGTTYLALKDKNGYIINTVRNEANPNGSNKAQLQARNYNSSGTLVKTGSLGVVVAKDGTLSYEVTEPNKFRQAIGLSNNFNIARLVSAKINRAYGSNVSITAPTISGYTFVCWVAVATDGWIGSCYVQNALAVTTNIWNASTGQSGSGTVNATALYRLNT